LFLGVSLSEIWGERSPPPGQPEKRKTHILFLFIKKKTTLDDNFFEKQNKFPKFFKKKIRTNLN
jgi:hypothetical protein